MRRLRPSARLLIARERAGEALGWARKAAAKAPRDCEVRMTLAASLIETGDFRAARTEMDELLRLATEQHLETNAALGSLRFAEGRNDLAGRYLEKGVRGGGILAMRDYARLLISLGRPAEALDWARKAAAKAPRDCEVRKTLAATLIETGDFKAARTEMDGLLRLAAEQHHERDAQAFLAGARRRLLEREKGAKE